VDDIKIFLVCIQFKNERYVLKLLVSSQKNTSHCQSRNLLIKNKPV
jgi:hypothetical protein